MGLMSSGGVARQLTRTVVKTVKPQAQAVKLRDTGVSEFPVQDYTNGLPDADSTSSEQQAANNRLRTDDSAGCVHGIISQMEGERRA